MPKKTKKNRSMLQKGSGAKAKTHDDERKAIGSMSHGDQRFYFFWKTASPFSQWHPSRYERNGVVFSCAEQGMMHSKALLFQDTEMAQQVLETNHPRTIKALGRKVRSFHPTVWNQHRERIVYDHTVSKFTQNPHLCQALLDTQGRRLVEASPNDSIWGIGLSEAAAKRMPSDQWPGLNLLGNILTRVRHEMSPGSLLVQNDEGVNEGVNEKKK